MRARVVRTVPHLVSQALCGREFGEGPGGKKWHGKGRRTLRNVHVVPGVAVEGG